MENFSDPEQSQEGKKPQETKADRICSETFRLNEKIFQRIKYGQA